MTATFKKTQKSREKSYFHFYKIRVCIIKWKNLNSQSVSFPLFLSSSLRVFASSDVIIVVFHFLSFVRFKCSMWQVQSRSTIIISLLCGISIFHFHILCVDFSCNFDDVIVFVRWKCIELLEIQCPVWKLCSILYC